jgi:acetolactate synthase-1/2/3 large subunit
VAEADLVFFVGSATGSMTTNFWRLPPPETATIQLDIDSEAIGRNYIPRVGILGDARTALELLAPLVEHLSPARIADWSARVRAFRQEHLQETAELRLSNAQPVRPERLCEELTSTVPKDAIVVVDTGHAGMWMSAFFDLTAPSQSFMRSAGHLGWAFSAGLGAKCACPSRPVVIFTGDLGFWYHIGEIETAVRWNIAAVTVVNNNHSGNQSRRGFALAYDGKPTERSRELWVHKEVNFARIAVEIGAVGIRVERPSEIKSAIEHALQSNRPAVIDVVTDIDAAAPLAWDITNWAQKY